MSNVPGMFAPHRPNAAPAAPPAVPRSAIPEIQRYLDATGTIKVGVEFMQHVMAGEPDDRVVRYSRKFLYTNENNVETLLQGYVGPENIILSAAYLESMATDYKRDERLVIDNTGLDVGNLPSPQTVRVQSYTIKATEPPLAIPEQLKLDYSLAIICLGMPDFLSYYSNFLKDHGNKMHTYDGDALLDNVKNLPPKLAKSDMEVAAVLIIYAMNKQYNSDQQTEKSINARYNAIRSVVGATKTTTAAGLLPMRYLRELSSLYIPYGKLRCAINYFIVEMRQSPKSPPAVTHIAKLLEFNGMAMFHLIKEFIEMTPKTMCHFMPIIMRQVIMFLDKLAILEELNGVGNWQYSKLISMDCPDISANQWKQLAWASYIVGLHKNPTLASMIVPYKVNSAEIQKAVCTPIAPEYLGEAPHERGMISDRIFKAYGISKETFGDQVTDNHCQFDLDMFNSIGQSLKDAEDKKRDNERGALVPLAPAAQQ